MFKFITMFCLINTVSGFYPFTFPESINVSIVNYNTSKCQNGIFENQINFMCLNKTMGQSNYRQCCYDEISKISPVYKPQFNTCYTIKYNQTIDNYMKYQCSDNDDFSVLEILSLISFAIVFILILYILTRCVYNCCNRTRYVPIE